MKHHKKNLYGRTGMFYGRVVVIGLQAACNASADGKVLIRNLLSLPKKDMIHRIAENWHRKEKN